MALTTSDVQHLSIGHLRVRVSVRGEGPPLLLIMGLGGHIEMWKPFQAELDGFRTIAFDAPGTGGSSVSPVPRLVGGYARIAAGVLDELGVSHAHVLGYSFGGAVAQELARRSPGKVDRLVLAATTCGWGAVPGQPIALLNLTNPMRYFSARYFRFIAPSTYGGRMRTESVLADQFATDRRERPPTLVGYMQQLAAIGVWASVPWSKRVEHRTLVLLGDDDPLVPAANAAILAERLPNADVAIIEGAGHLLLFDSAHEVSSVVTRFLTS
jgi:pimeloyl-ACP methyl ester carboxylesterase